MQAASPRATVVSIPIGAKITPRCERTVPAFISVSKPWGLAARALAGTVTCFAVIGTVLSWPWATSGGGVSEDPSRSAALTGTAGPAGENRCPRGGGGADPETKTCRAETEDPKVGADPVGPPVAGQDPQLGVRGMFSLKGFHAALPRPGHVYPPKGFQARGSPDWRGGELLGGFGVFALSGFHADPPDLPWTCLPSRGFMSRVPSYTGGDSGGPFG